MRLEGSCCRETYAAGAGARSTGAARAGAVGVAAAAHFDCVVVDGVVLEGWLWNPEDLPLSVAILDVDVVVEVLLLRPITLKQGKLLAYYMACPSICPTMRDLCVRPAKSQGLTAATRAFSPPHKARRRCATAIG